MSDIRLRELERGQGDDHGLREALRRAKQRLCARCGATGKHGVKTPAPDPDDACEICWDLGAITIIDGYGYQSIEPCECLPPCRDCAI